jgi:hypothetical protein
MEIGQAVMMLHATVPASALSESVVTGDEMKPVLPKLILALILLLGLASLASCASRSGRSENSMGMIALESGVDKKSMSSEEDYGGQYRDQGGESGYAVTADMSPAQQGMPADDGRNSPAPEAPPSPGQGTTPAEPPASGVASSIKDWLNPSAWAQETALDESFIIRTGSIEMEIEDFDKSSAEVTTIAKRHGGIITDSQMQKYGDDMRVGWITLRVPSGKFQQCYDDLRAIGDVKVQSVSSEDVTTEFIAGVSRMEALRIEHQTLQGMLEDAREIQRSRGLGEAYSVLLDTQARLSTVTTELQTVENRVSSLKDRIQRSTISVNLSERVIAPPIDEADWSIGATFERAKRDLQQGIDATLGGLVYFLVNGLIWWIIWLGILWLVWIFMLRKLWRRFASYAVADKEPAAAASGKDKTD